MWGCYGGYGCGRVRHEELSFGYGDSGVPSFYFLGCLLEEYCHIEMGRIL